MTKAIDMNEYSKVENPIIRQMANQSPPPPPGPKQPEMQHGDVHMVGGN